MIPRRALHIALAVLALGLIALLSASALSAQVNARGGVQERDTLTTAQRLAERLRLLDRAPGADSATIAADSARLADTMGRRGPGQPVIQGADSILRALLELEGFTATQYGGQSAIWMAENERLHLLGDSAKRGEVVTPEGTRLLGDSIDYDQATGEGYAIGNPILVPAQGNEVSASSMRFQVENRTGSALDARTRLTEGGDWNISGDLPLLSQTATYGSHLMFTSCDQEVPHYHFRASQYKYVRGEDGGGTIVARNVTLRFADVPVFWLPFIAQSTNSERSSGLLPVRFSVNDIVRSSGGYRRRISNVGYYWAMSEYADAALALDWFDGNYTALTGSFRYRWLRQFLEGTLDLRQYWRAEGGSELAVNSRHQWQLSERTSFQGSARYASSTDFVTDNSFNPQEITQSIDSEGGVQHRFDWGSLSVNANRRQFLSDDRVETTFPNLSLSLSTVTLLRAPITRANWYNNLTWSGTARASRSSRDVAQTAEFDPGRLDTGELRGAVSSSISLGNLRLTGGLSYEERSTAGLPIDSLPFFPGQVSESGIRAFTGETGRRLFAANHDLVDIARTTLDWNANLDYQQTLIGSTTLTPRITFSQSRVRSDTVQVAQSFVAGPMRTAFGAELKSDIYGFYPGLGGFERLRHKVTPSFSYDWSPAVQPTQLQEQVFGARSRLPENVIAVTLNQTFEAKRPSTAEGDEDGDGAAAGQGAAGQAAAGQGANDTGGPRRLQQGEIVNLLSLRTSAVRYDFVDDPDDPTDDAFLDGFRTMQITNQISSDFLRGLSVSMAHDLFREDPVGDGGDTERVFDPHLAQMNLGFQVSSRSGIFRWLGLTGGGEERSEDEMFEGDEVQPDFVDDDLALSGAGSDETSMVPGQRTVQDRPVGSDTSVGEWSANLSYSLARPRAGGRGSSSMLQANVRLQPTEDWEMSWNTSFDLQRNAFNDHTIRLTRDLHRWRANFDFLQTATGNWTFRFEVSLIDNRDLKFDYQQRNLDRRSGSGN